MRQLDKTKVRHLSKFSQLILLNDEAQIVSSCNSIFSATALQNIPVTTWFPFLESIFEYLFQLKPESSDVKFSKIETPIKELPGIYDFTFSKVLIDQKEMLLWTIYDYTNLYEDFKHYQQRKNEFEILRETFERRYKHLKSFEDINTGQNIVLENFNHFQLNYYNRLKSALQSPVNALDGFTFVLSNNLQKDNFDYLEALKQSLNSVQEIIKELEGLKMISSATLEDINQVVPFNPHERINNVILLARKNFNLPLEISTEIQQGVPESLKGNKTLFSQILFGLLINIIQFHPFSRLQLNAQLLERKHSQVRLRFQIIKFLGRQDTVLNPEDINALILRLSLIKQLIDLQKGNISVDKDAKSLGIIVTCDLEYTV